MDWNDVRLFLAIARAGTLSAAAPDLGLSQPTAGRRLRAFEQQLGVSLFQRTAHGFQLTGDGETLLQSAERVEAEMLGLQRRLGSDAGGLAGELRICTSEWFANAVLAPRLTRFVRDNPSITIELLGETRLFDLARREADVVFRFQPFEEADVVTRRFVCVRYGVYASPDYLERHGPVSLGDGGRGHRLVAMDVGHDRLADVAWLRERLPEATYGLRSNSRDIQASSCELAGGIAVLPRILADRRSLTEVQLDGVPPGREVWLGYRSDLRRLRRLRAALDCLAANMPAEI